MEETVMKKSILTILMLTSALALGACDTDEDFDDQVEDAAEEVEDAAEEIDD
jgi:predicted small secreted protein